MGAVWFLQVLTQCTGSIIPGGSSLGEGNRPQVLRIPEMAFHLEELSIQRITPDFLNQCIVIMANLAELRLDSETGLFTEEVRRSDGFTRVRTLASGQASSASDRAEHSQEVHGDVDDSH